MTVSRIVGLGMSNGPPQQFNFMPGYVLETWGYHGDDGLRHANSKSTQYSETYKTGDTIGCGIDCDGRMFFTKNGNHLGSPSAAGRLSSKY